MPAPKVRIERQNHSKEVPRMFHVFARPRAMALLALVCLLGCLPARAPAMAAKSTPAPTATPVPTMTPPPLDEEALPAPIVSMIRAAQMEIAEVKLQRLPRSNKYTRWYYDDKREVGWCGNFFSWCANAGGLPAIKMKDAAPVAEDALVYAKEAAVPKAFKTYEAMGRVATIPRPGYEIIYGVIGGTPYTHIGMVESVTDLGGGEYELTTLEGNVSNTVKRYCYRYVLEPKTKHHNQQTVPEALQTRDDAQYELHKDNWYITGFGATWK
jgi:hypothetical protein